MKTVALAAFLVVSCGTEQSFEPLAPELDDTASAEVVSESKASSPTTVCSQNGAFDFGLTGENLTAYEGRLVVAAAVEGTYLANQPQVIGEREVVVATRIKRGKFAFRCPTSLHENYFYPSWAVFIDVNGDGRCSKGDVAVGQQLYGWADHVISPIARDHWSTISADSPSAPIVDVGRTGFCNAYFP